MATQSLAITEDTVIYEAAPTIVFGDALLSLPCGSLAGGAGDEYRVLLRFPTPFLDKMSIGRAVLKLYKDGHAGQTPSISVHRLTTSWDIATVNWNNQPLRQPGADAIQTIASDDGSLRNFEITDIVRGWINGTLTNNGLLVKLTITTTNFISYHAKNSASTTLVPTIDLLLNHSDLQPISTGLQAV